MESRAQKRKRTESNNPSNINKPNKIQHTLNIDESDDEGDIQILQGPPAHLLPRIQSNRNEPIILSDSEDEKLPRKKENPVAGPSRLVKSNFIREITPIKARRNKRARFDIDPFDNPWGYNDDDDLKDLDEPAPIPAARFMEIDFNIGRPPDREAQREEVNVAPVPAPARAIRIQEPAEAAGEVEDPYDLPVDWLNEDDDYFEPGEGDVLGHQPQPQPQLQPQPQPQQINHQHNHQGPQAAAPAAQAPPQAQQIPPPQAQPPQPQAAQAAPQPLRPQPQPQPKQPADHLPSILEVLPDISPEWVLEQLTNEYTLGRIGGDVAGRIIQQALEMDSYPKSSSSSKIKGKGKGKAQDIGDEDGEDGGDEEGGNGNGKDYRSKDYRKEDRKGSRYEGYSIAVLSDYFPRIPLPHIRQTYNKEEQLFVPTYYVLLAQNAMEGNTKPYNELQRPRSTNTYEKEKGLYDRIERIPGAGPIGVGLGSGGFNPNNGTAGVGVSADQPFQFTFQFPPNASGPSIPTAPQNNQGIGIGIAGPSNTVDPTIAAANAQTIEHYRVIGLTEFNKEKKWLDDYLNKEREDEDRKKAREIAHAEELANGGGIECGCCFGEEILSEMFQCAEGHLFCRECSTRHAETLLGEQKHTIACMDMSGCPSLFPISELSRLLSTKSLELFHRLKQSSELESAGLDNLETCPFCPYAIVIDNPQEKLFRCDNPDCGEVTCRKCKSRDHIPKSCEENEKDKKADKRHVVEDAMSEALIRRCPGCKQPYIKSDGCNKITCAKCRCLSCYICQTKITGYDHFDQTPHFPGQPRQNNKCLLWDKDAGDRDREMVLAARDAAQAEVRQAAEAEGVALDENDLAVAAPDPTPPRPGPAQLLPPGLAARAFQFGPPAGVALPHRRPLGQGIGAGILPAARAGFGFGALGAEAAQLVFGGGAGVGGIHAHPQPFQFGGPAVAAPHNPLNNPNPNPFPNNLGLQQQQRDRYFGLHEGMQARGNNPDLRQRLEELQALAGYVREAGGGVGGFGDAAQVAALQARLAQVRAAAQAQALEQARAQREQNQQHQQQIRANIRAQAQAQAEAHRARAQEVAERHQRRQARREARAVNAERLAVLQGDAIPPAGAGAGALPQQVQAQAGGRLYRRHVG